MSPTARRVLIGVSTVLVLGLLVAAFLFFFESRESSVHRIPPGPAFDNPYLALHRLAEKRGWEVATVGELDDVDSTWVVLLADPTARFAPDMVHGWARWIYRGGHLIMPVPDKQRDEVSAPLLAQLGFKVRRADAEPWPWASGVTHQYFEMANYPHPGATAPEQTSDISGAPDEAELPRMELRSALGHWVAEDADWLGIYSPSGEPGTGGFVIAASRVYGWGRITLVRDTRSLDNLNIGKGDHAALGLAMVGLRVPAASEWADYEPGELTPRLSLVLRGQGVSWLMYVLRKTWPGVVVMMVMLAFALAAGLRRFGPLLPDPPAARRSRGEHIEAVGRFLWRHDAAPGLVKATQDALLKSLARQNPNLSSAEGNQRWEIIARALQIEPVEARKLFQNPDEPRHAERFVAKIRALETYRRRR